jgi:hypothetical protein
VSKLREEILMNGDAGKGDDPRNCHTDAFREGYDQINWHRKPQPTPAPKVSVDECAELVNYFETILKRTQL